LTTIYPGLAHLRGNPVVAIDFETTGGKAGYHEIIQVGAILLDGNLEPNPDIRPFYHNIAPVFPERAEHEATAVHGLNLAELMLDAPSSDKVADLFLEWFENLKLPQAKRLTPLAHNWVFEYSFSNAWLGADLHEHIFHFHPRDGMELALSMKDRAAFAGLPMPFSYVGLKAL
jgi:DNA polymerase III epsilon subunit-like protein